jgi:hypothetical protein
MGQSEAKPPAKPSTAPNATAPVGAKKDCGTEVDPDKGYWGEGGKEAYKDEKIEVKSGVELKSNGKDSAYKDAISIKVKCDKNPHVLQFIYREIIDKDGKPVKKTMTTTGGTYETTTDPTNPVWNTDSAAKPVPYYEAGGASRSDPGELTIYDQPTVNPGPGQTVRATFKSYVICDGKVTKEVTWVRSKKDGEDPTYTVSVAAADKVPDWATAQLKKQGYSDAP